MNDTRARASEGGRAAAPREPASARARTGWDGKQTAHRQATRCFNDLLNKVRDNGKLVGVEIGLEELVDAVSFMWAMAFHRGALLSNHDLLKGEVMAPMAEELSTSWELVDHAITYVTDLIRQGTGEDAARRPSIDALVALWTLHFSALKRAAELGFSATETTELTQKMEAALLTQLKRGLSVADCWARWLGSDGAVYEGCASDLRRKIASYATATDVNTIALVFQSQLSGSVSDIPADAG